MPALALLVLASCHTGTGGDGDYSGAVVTALSLDPASVVLTASPDVAATQQFVATATFDDGSSAPLDNELISWETSNQSAGTLGEDGLFTTTLTNGGTTSVTATHNGIVASADVTVVYQAEIDAGGPSSDEFSGTDAGSIGWIYPADGVTLPRNVPSMTFMCEEVSGADGYLFHFTTPTTDITVTSSDHRWTATGDQWVQIAAANTDGQVTVQCKAASGGSVYSSSDLHIQVDRLDALGSIYYWSTTDDGIVKVPFSADEGELFYAPATGSGKCVGCHVVTEDRMGVVYGQTADSNFYEGITDISSGEPDEMTEMDVNGYFTTVNPDNTLLLSSTAEGGLNLWDIRTGELKGEVDTGGTPLTMVVWSPNGDKIAGITADDYTGCEICFSRGHLVVADISADGSTLTNLTTLYDPGQTYDPDTQINVYYPAWSPDGDWIAFNEGISVAYDNPQSKLYAISAAGGDPIELTNANDTGDIGNSWPHWGPLPDDDIYWLTFSSKRDYGDVMTDGYSQIWVTAFNPETAAQGTDPSAPAFWLSNQDVETSNHSTYWGP